MSRRPPPSYTIAQIRESIPPELLKSSLLISSLYLLVNILCCAALAFGATFIDSAPSILRPALWFTFWVVQGFFFTGLWVVGHECGHRAFSPYKTINDFVGLILHTMLLVPYHSWRISHGLHHKNTAHMTKDQVFVPPTRSAIAPWQEAVSESPFAALVDGILIIIALTLGWPAYLTANLSAPPTGRRTNHFEPSSPIFKPQHFWHIVLSDIALAVFIFGLFKWAQATSWSTVGFYWGVPYLWTNFWLVLITYLHHTHIEIPHYREGEWNFVRGALSTVDRDYGFLNYIMHHIGDTHIAHHLFSTMPHYNAPAVTEHLRKFLGEEYRKDSTPIFAALWREWNSCFFVDDEGSIVYYKGRKDLVKKHE